MKNIRRYLYIAAITVIILFTFILAYNYFIQAIKSTGEQTQAEINGTVKSSRDFVEILAAYGNDFMEEGGFKNDEQLYNKLEYNADSNSFNLDSIGGTALKNKAGNTTGLGKIPQQGIKKTELNLVLSYNDYFYRLYQMVPDATWLYYTSQSSYINIYPWVSSTEFKYSDELKKVAFYQNATPESDPLRGPVWTPVYVDAAGKGRMVTVSDPIYSGDDFMGVVSIDLTTNTLSSLLKGKYASYLIDSSNSVIATGQKLQNNNEVKKLDELIGISASDMQNIWKVNNGSIQRVGMNYIYKYNLFSAPWTMVIVFPVYLLVAKAILCTLPIIIICILLLLTLREAERRKKAEAKIRDIAITDALTGLKNRYYLESVIEKEMSSSDRYEHKLSIVIFDLDHFKRVNDKWGHPVGDEVLKQIADVTGAIVRKADILIRLGGEEFLIVLPETDITGACETAEKIRLALEENRHPVAGQCTASFGVAEKIREENFIRLYQRADEALYVAKKSGRNRVVSYETIKNFPFAAVYLKWNEEWNSGNETIDEQHRELLESANNLLFLSFSNAKSEEIDQKLELLLRHMTDHFTDEEKLQAAIEYPDYPQHVEIHKGLLDKALKLKEDYKNGSEKPSAIFSFVVDDVIVGHMLEEDVKFYPYISD